MSNSTVEEFKNALRGKVIEPMDNEYDEARKVWNGLIHKHPALIAQCSGTADVIESVKFARENNLQVSVRGGGHNIAGQAVCDDGLVIDLTAMRAVHVDPVSRTARAQGGATWGDFDRETQVFGLATTGGLVSTTGIAGLTLGGGLGWLRNKYGMSCDNLISVDMVTADGDFLTASETENEDLFWALKGGGGNFGIVTSFQYQLHEVGPSVMLCATMYPLDTSEKVLPKWHEFVVSAPDEVSSQAYFWAIPEMEPFPEEVQGENVIIITAMYSGDPNEGEKILYPLREIAEPVIDLSGQLPYTAVQTMFDPFFPKNERYYYFKSIDLASMDADVMNAIISGARNRPVPTILLAVWHYGGQMNRIGEEATAFGSRDTSFLFSVDSVWDNPEDTDRIIEWSRHYLEEMEPYSGEGMYLNFPGFGEEGEEMVQSAFGPNYERLVKIKSKYDPDNFFNLNQNIKPR